MVAICLTTSFICAVLFLYPYIGYPAVLRLLPARAIARRDGNVESATLLFCCYNEEASLSDKLDNLERLKALHPNLQILAYDDKSDDRSLALMQGRPDLLRVIEGAGRTGKAHGMKRLAQEATGDILIFTDANVLLDLSAVDNLMAWYADPSVGGVCGSLKYLGADHSATAYVGSTYWKLEEYLKSEESRTGNVMGADGSIFSLRRELYPDFPDTVLDDLTVSMAAVFAGKRLIKVGDVVAYEKLVSDRNDEIARKIRIAARAYHTHLFLSAQLARMGWTDKFKYGSRKILRWFGASFLAIGAIALVGALTLLNPLLGLGTALLAVALGVFGLRAKHGPLASAMEIVIAIVATQVGVVRAIRGQTFAVWTPAKSR